MSHHTCTHMHMHAHAHKHTSHIHLCAHKQGYTSFIPTQALSPGKRWALCEFTSLLPRTWNRAARAPPPGSLGDVLAVIGRVAAMGTVPRPRSPLNCIQTSRESKGAEKKSKHCDNMFAIYCWRLQVSAQSSPPQGSLTKVPVAGSHDITPASLLGGAYHPFNHPYICVIL